MSKRTFIAIVVGISLGCISGYFLGKAGYGAPLLLLFWGTINSLITYRIADRKAIWVSIVPNIIMISTAGIVEWHRSDRSFPLLAILLGATVITLFSLLISWPSYWFRNRKRK
jgi:uncharacterized membrane protein YcaP (DUF421 family)